MKNDSRHRSLPSQVILGIAAIGLGILFLLDNLDIWEVRRAFHFWPSVFILFGVLKLWDARSTSGYLVGGGLIALGVVSTLHRLGYLYFNARDMWPLALIVIGAVVIIRALSGRKAMEGGGMKAASDDSVVDITAILGGFERSVITPTFRGGEITAVMGGCELDMRESSIQGDAVLNVFVVMGGITIKVPRDWKVILEGTPLMGGFEEKTNSPPDNSKRLIIKGYAIMGGVEVRN